MNNFECDKEGKKRIIEYFRKKAQIKGYTIVEDQQNDNPFSNIDIKFKAVKNTKELKYSIEVKERKETYEEFITKYQDVMFEEDKIEKLIEDNINGYKTYFVNLFSNNKALVFSITKDTKFQYGVSHQFRYTEKKCSNKENIVKIYLKYDQAKLIDLNE